MLIGRRKKFKIAIFGLSLNKLKDIKKELEFICKDFSHIDWVNISEPNIDILLVNDIFFESPTILNIIKNQHIPYLRLIQNKDRFYQIEGDKLYLPFTEVDKIKQWFQQRYLDIPTVQKMEHNIVRRTKSLDTSKVIQELLDQHNSALQIFDSKENIAIVNTRTEQVWVDSDVAIQPIDHTLNYTYAKMQTLKAVSQVQGLDVRYWLWNIIWESEILLKEHSNKQAYKLEQWPHPHNKEERQIIFKIAACFECGASISQVHQQSKIPISIIQKFVSTALSVHILKKIDLIDAKLIINEGPVENVFQGFLNKLKLRLGI